MGCLFLTMTWNGSTWHRKEEMAQLGLTSKAEGGGWGTTTGRKGKYGSWERPLDQKPQEPNSKETWGGKLRAGERKRAASYRWGRRHTHTDMHTLTHTVPRLFMNGIIQPQRLTEYVILKQITANRKLQEVNKNVLKVSDTVISQHCSSWMIKIHPDTPAHVYLMKTSFQNTSKIVQLQHHSRPLTHLPGLQLLRQVELLLDGVQQLAVQRHDVYFTFGQLHLHRFLPAWGHRRSVSPAHVGPEQSLNLLPHSYFCFCTGFWIYAEVTFV